MVYWGFTGIDIATFGIELDRSWAADLWSSGIGGQAPRLDDDCVPGVSGIRGVWMWKEINNNKSFLVRFVLRVLGTGCVGSSRVFWPNEVSFWDMGAPDWQNLVRAYLVF